MNNVTTFFNCKIRHKMTMPCSWFGWMKSSCKSHLYVTAFITWCHIFSFTNIILCHLSKATKHYSKLHVVIKLKLNHKYNHIFGNSL
jgi:hypothetical protein